VLLCDGHPVWRAGFRAILDAEPDIEVAGEPANGRDALSMAWSLRPDVTLVDADISTPGGIEVARRLAGPWVEDPLRVVILTARDTSETLIEALRAGASGYLQKDLSGENLVAAVRVVAAGEAMLAPTALRRLLDRIARWLPSTQTSRNDDMLDRLTRREREVLRLIAQGMTNKDVAEHLGLSQATIKSHASHILTKLDLQDRAQAVVMAYQTGLVQPEMSLLPRPMAAG
jgi:DNA-binding NarL/FixJ family response regulator